MLLANSAALVLSAVDTATGAGEADVEVHTVNACGRIVLDTKIDVLLNTESEVSCSRNNTQNKKKYQFTNNTRSEPATSKVHEPSLEKLTNSSSNSLTLRPRSMISRALAPRMVTWAAICSLRRIPKERSVYLALENRGSWPQICCSTREALVSLSPEAPQQMFNTSLSTLTSRILLSACFCLFDCSEAMVAVECRIKRSSGLTSASKTNKEKQGNATNRKRKTEEKNQIREKYIRKEEELAKSLVY